MSSALGKVIHFHLNMKLRVVQCNREGSSSHQSHNQSTIFKTTSFHVEYRVPRLNFLFNTMNIDRAGERVTGISFISFSMKNC